MCGRYSIAKSADIITQRFSNTSIDSRFRKTWNSIPGNLLPVILSNKTSKIQCLRWGFVPPWIKESNTSLLHRSINARLETINKKPFFQESFSRRPCLVIADAYYEWKLQDGIKIPYRISFKSSSIFSMAGIWSKSNINNKTIHSFAIITTKSHKSLSNIHHRMPIVLSKQLEKEWINQDISPIERINWLEKLDFENLMVEKYTISQSINSPKNDYPEIIYPHKYSDAMNLFK